MSKISEAEVKKLARLSKLVLGAEEVKIFQSELEEILGYVERLSAIDTSDVGVTGQVTGLEMAVRDDELIDYKSDISKILASTPADNEHYIQTKKVL